MTDSATSIVPQLELSEARFSFNFTNFSKIKSSVFSPPILVRHLTWRTEIRSNLLGGEIRTLGIYLWCSNDSKSTNWSCYAQAELRLLPIKPNLQPIVKQVLKKVFEDKFSGWGFSKFKHWNDIMNPENGYIQDDAITIEVSLSVDEPKGVPWYSRKHTGYVGFKNQPTKSYLNSILQILFCTNEFRSAICSKSIESDENTLLFDLQRIFQHLKSSKDPVDNDVIIKHFKKDELGLRGQEFLKIIIGKIESQCLSNVKKQFEGKILITSAQTESDDESDTESDTESCAITKTKLFSGIHFNIEGKMNLYESFNDHIASIALVYQNRKKLNDGKLTQNAEVIVQFTKLPQVLILHLEQMPNKENKNGKSFEFYDQINLKKYCQESTGASANYDLHSVLAQSSDEFVAFINPHDDGKWLKFDNDVVMHCTKEDAIDGNYTKARMLVYINNHMTTNEQKISIVKVVCPICMEMTKHDQKYSTICGHLFCEPCIKQEVELRKSCPTCKKKLTPKLIHRIFSD